VQNFYQQLRQRRVIRSAVVYVALVWGALQVADLLADSGFLSDDLVRVLIIAALVGLPLILISSWFFEAPWRRRKGLSIAGDVLVMLAIAAGVLLFAWQQYFASFARPTLAITAIEATDARSDSQAFGPYLAGRLRAVLAMQPELTVIELTSSLRPELMVLGVGDKARALAADYVLAGTLNQRDDLLLINLQLHDRSGQLMWSEGFEDRLLDLGDLAGRMLEAVWAQLPLPEDGLATARSQIADCEYPPSTEAIRFLLDFEGGLVDPGSAIDDLTAMIDTYQDNGLLHRARALAYFARRDEAAPPRKPVLHSLALQDLQQLSDRCPASREAGLLRLHSTDPELLDRDARDKRLAEFPNDAALLIAFAEAWHREGDREKSIAIAREACRIDALNPQIVCSAVSLFREAGDGETAAQVLTHAGRLLTQSELYCN